MSSEPVDPKLVEYIAGLRHECALSGPCSDNGDGCTCSAVELSERQQRRDSQTPTLQASDLDVEGVRPTDDERRAFVTMAHSIIAGHTTDLTTDHLRHMLDYGARIETQRTALAAQLAAEKARADKAEGEREGDDHAEAYQEGFEDGRSEAKGTAVKLWDMLQKWAVQSGFISEPDHDGYTAQELMDAVLVGFGERQPPRTAVNWKARAEAAEANLAAANKQIEEMRGALEPFAECAAHWDSEDPALHVFFEAYEDGKPVPSRPVADFRRARTALSHEAHNG